MNVKKLTKMVTSFREEVAKPIAYSATRHVVLFALHEECRAALVGLEDSPIKSLLSAALDLAWRGESEAEDILDAVEELLDI